MRQGMDHYFLVPKLELGNEETNFWHSFSNRLYNIAVVKLNK